MKIWIFINVNVHKGIVGSDTLPIPSQGNCAGRKSVKTLKLPSQPSYYLALKFEHVTDFLDMNLLICKMK